MGCCEQDAKESEDMISRMELQLKDSDDLIIHLEEALASERSNAADRAGRLSNLENHIHGLASKSCEECACKDDVIKGLKKQVSAECQECLQNNKDLDKLKHQLEIEGRLCKAKDATIQEQQAEIADLHAAVAELQGSCKESTSRLLQKDGSVSALQVEAFYEPHAC